MNPDPEGDKRRAREEGRARSRACKNGCGSERTYGSSRCKKCSDAHRTADLSMFGNKS